ncbi:MAG TPA: decaprenyl-phosphate phosphoribosyltransferase [Burkholderiales bacterium]|nr:decaprenyl-phosphate phosphoribosyltransferase [Burkholderiales bacterium]
MGANLQEARRVLPKHRVVAVFDLDGTLTSRDTLFPFLRLLVGTPAFLARLPLVAVVLAAMALHLVTRGRAKELVLALFVRGCSRGDLELRGERFAREHLPGLLRAQAEARLRWHLASGHHCVLLTASPACYAVPFARAFGFHDVAATELEYDERGCATGRLDGENCQGGEKVHRLEALLGDLAALTLHGYGDSAGDRAFLARCSEAHYRPFREAAARSAPEPATGTNRLGDLLRLMRPHQWLKNTFVFVGVLFGHAWTAPTLLAAACAAAAFCLMASAVYIVNDYVDRERDRVHPRKRQRPLASGRVTPGAALVVASGLALGSLVLAGSASPVVATLVAFYAAMNLAYSFWLKNIVILDVFVVAAGFILRILAGTLGIGIAPSQWLLVCSLFLTLFLGFTKRRSELLSVGGEFLIHRKALLNYNPQLLDKMMGICAAAVLMSYSLYTMSPATARVHGTENLIYTIPFVAYGMFRYLFLLHAKHAGTDTSHDLARDHHLVLTVLAWAAVTVALIA